MSYSDMEMQWGSPFAHHVLCEIEKASNIVPQFELHPEVRLANALRAQDGAFVERIAA